MGDLRTIGKGAAYVFTGIVISKLLTYLWRIIVARIGPEQYGLVSIALAVLGVANIVSLLGLDAAVIRYIAYYHGKSDASKMKGVITSSLKIAAPLSLFVFAAVFLYSDFIAITFFKNPAIAPLIKIISIAIVPCLFYNVSAAALTGLKRIKPVVFSRQIIESVTRLFATLLLLYLGYGVLGVGAAYVAAFVFGAIYSLYSLEKAFPFIKTKIIATPMKRELLSYSLPLLMSGIIIQMLTWTDILMIGYFKTAADVGIYSTAAPTAGIMLIVPAAIGALFLPVITTAYARNLMEDVKESYKRVTRMIITANLPIALLMIFFSEDLIIFLFGKEYAGGSFALVLLSIGYFVSSIISTSTSVLDMFKRTKLLMAISIAATVINAVLNYILIPAYGISGAAFASAVSMILSGSAISYFAYGSIKAMPYDRSFAYVIVLGIASISGVYFFLHSMYDVIPLIPAILGVSFFFLIYAGLIFAFKIIEVREVKEIIGIFKKKAG